MHSLIDGTIVSVVENDGAVTAVTICTKQGDLVQGMFTQTDVTHNSAARKHLASSVTNN